MSAFNRVVVVIVALVILAGAIITLLVTTGAATPDVLPYGWFESTLEKAADASGGDAAAVIVVSVIIALGMITLLSFEFIPLRKRVPLLVSSTEEGITTIDQESVRVLAEKTAATGRNVRNAECSIRAKTQGLAISCRASVALGSNIPEVSAELKSKIKEAVERSTGLPVAEVDVKAKYETVEAKRLAVS